MSELPEPLSPPDCDLRGLEWMPLFGDRLFSSDTWLMATPEGRCAALALWWASWKQKPAGSVPDQDRALCQLAGYGMAVASWNRVKREAMRGWVLCRDGRYYHPVVCSLASDAMSRRVKERERKAAWRGKHTSANTNVPRDTTGTAASGNGSVRVERTVQDRTGQDKEESKKERTLNTHTETMPRARRAAAPDGAGFDDWWAAYPLKKAKGHARAAYAKALTKTDPPTLLAALDRRWPANPKYIPHPTTWLNGECWTDEIDNRDPVLAAAEDHARAIGFLPELRIVK